MAGETTTKLLRAILIVICVGLLVQLGSTIIQGLQSNDLERRVLRLEQKVQAQDRFNEELMRQLKNGEVKFK